MVDNIQNMKIQNLINFNNIHKSLNYDENNYHNNLLKFNGFSYSKYENLIKFESFSLFIMMEMIMINWLKFNGT